jgi:Lon protease-like protein
MRGLHRVGCTAEMQDVRRLPDGRFDIVTRGGRRFRLTGLDSASKPYLMGSVEYMPDVETRLPAELARLLGAAARAAHRRYCSTAWKVGEWAEPAADVEFGTLPHLLATDCLLPIADRQQLLEQCSPVERLRMIRKLLARETFLLRRLRAVPAPLSSYAAEHSAN